MNTIFEQLSHCDDGYGNAQAWVDLEDGRELEIVVYDDDGTMYARVHCNNDEFERDVFHATLGVIDMTGRSTCPQDFTSIMEWANRVCKSYPYIKN